MIVGDVNPIQTDTTDSSYFFNNEDAISFNLGNNNDSNKQQCNIKFLRYTCYKPKKNKTFNGGNQFPPFFIS